MWAELEKTADEEILERFPILADGPGIGKDDRIIPKPNNNGVAPADSEKLITEPGKQRKEEHTPWRLFRGIAPPANPRRDLVFLGMMMSMQTVLRSEMAALWAYAYLNGCLGPQAQLSNRPRPPSVRSEKEDPGKSTESQSWLFFETALFSRFGRWRYPMGYGSRFPDFVFDAVPYTDMLLRDLGLRTWRKGRTWLGELCSGPYLAGDYKGLIEEWRGLDRKSNIMTG
ncbi:MAG: hypothetical protein Q9224_006646 [Gallowayella concinna]